MAQVYKYTIHDINNIILNGFEYKISDEIIDIISNLTTEVGSPTYIKTPNFQKQNIENEETKTQKYHLFLVLHQLAKCQSAERQLA